MNLSTKLALFAALLMAGPPSASAAATYIVSGTFQSQTGAEYALLSGGSFSGSFVVADGYFPRPAGSSAYLYDAPYSIDLFNSAGQQVAKLANTASQGTYLQIANTHAEIYGGLRIFFRDSSTDYLQLVVPLDFTGTGAIAPVMTNYALVLGSNYAYLQSGKVSLSAPAAVPEPGTWSMLIAGFGAVGFMMRYRGRADVDAVRTR